jgi:hypothetical protein
MEIEQPTPNIAVDKLLDAIKNDYKSVALDPHKGYHFHTGRAALDRMGAGPQAKWKASHR